MHAKENETVRRPNIVLINCDDLGYGDLGCYGSALNETPALDQLARDGMRYTDFYMASPVCSPSRGGMLTGCYPPRIGFGSFDGQGVLFPGQAVGLNPAEITIATLLRQAGYATQIVGKWHCGDQPDFLPTRHGFDHYFGIPYSNDMGRQAGRQWCPPPLPLLRDETVIQQQPDQTGLTERYAEESVRFIRANCDRPFFLYLAHMHVHLPLYAAPRFLRESRNGVYGACVAAVDWVTAVLLDELKRQGLDDNTLVVFTSDNGARGDYGGSNAPLRGGKGTTWEGGMRLPCIMRWPGRIPAGTVCRDVVTSMDFLPTLARLAGTTEPADRIIDGKDIRPLMFAESGARSPHEAFFYYRCDDLEAVRRGRWKLFVLRWDGAIRKGHEVCELYDLDADIGETANLAGRHPDVVRELQALAEGCRQDLGDGARGLTGANCRPIGRVPSGRPLTEYDPQHPYIEAEYDLPDSG